MFVLFLFLICVLLLRIIPIILDVFVLFLFLIYFLLLRIIPIINDLLLLPLFGGIVSLKHYPHLFVVVVVVAAAVDFVLLTC